MAHKIFLSPSNQTRNVYAYGDTTEDIQCGRVANALEIALERRGFEVKLMHYYAMMKLPWGQIKKLLTEDVIAVFEKYGVKES